MLELKLGDTDAWQALHEAILDTFGGPENAKVDEAFSDRRIYSVSQAAVQSLGQVFDSLEQSKFFSIY